MRASWNPQGSFITRRSFLTAAGAGAVSLLARRLGAAEGDVGPRKPNIVVILADDLGYADVGYHGCKDIPTPAIDSIAAAGTSFTNGYVTGPMCSPTRAGLVTGRYQQRFGHELNTGKIPQATDPAVGLPVEEITIADVLKSAGYATGVVGKWHLGMHPNFHPFKRGFDEFFGFEFAGHTYLPPHYPKWSPIRRGMEAVEENEYLTDAFTREATAFVDRHKDKPFFLYLAYSAPHTPLEATEKYLKRFAAIEDPKRRTYAAMVAAMDDGIAALLAKLRQYDLERDTLVIFLNDNGGPSKQNASRNDPLRSGKGTVYEGGIRVPYAMRWPGRIPAGKKYELPVTSLDILPTAAAAAGAKLPAGRIIDGKDLLPFIAGRKDGPPHEEIFWRFGASRAVRRGNWKFVYSPARSELYDLAADIGEQTNLAGQNPAVVASMSESLAKWESQMIPPRWRPQRSAPKPAPATRPAEGQ